MLLSPCPPETYLTALHQICAVGGRTITAPRAAGFGGSCRSADRAGTTPLSKGFGRRQAYESLTCTTRGGSCDELWGFRVGAVALSGWTVGFEQRMATWGRTFSPECAAKPVHVSALLVGGGRIIAGERMRRGFLQRRFGRMDGKQAMPDHGVLSRAGGVDDGGARGWRQRSKVSMIVMCPPQHGQGVR